MGNRYKVEPYTPGSVNEGGMWGIPFEGYPEVGSVELGKGGVGHTYYQRPAPPPAPPAPLVTQNSFVGDKFPTVWVTWLDGRPSAVLALEEAQVPPSGTVSFKADFDYVNTVPLASKSAVQKAVVGYLQPLLEVTYGRVPRGTPLAEAGPPTGGYYPTLYVRQAGRGLDVALVPEKSRQNTNGSVTFQVDLDFVISDERVSVEAARSEASRYLQTLLEGQFDYNPGSALPVAPPIDSTQPLGSPLNPVRIGKFGGL